MVILFFLLMGLLIVSCILTSSSNSNISNIGLEICKFSIAGLFFYSLTGLININKPSAMDVYQGKTTIEITYKDGIAVDSVVVFKEKKK